MEKSEAGKNGINQLVDIRTIGNDGKTVFMAATKDERTSLAERFNVPLIHSLSVKGKLFWENDTIVFEGNIQTDIEQICVVSLEQFRREYTYPFRVLFAEDISQAENSIDVEADIFEPIAKGKINLNSVITEEFGVHLDIFPKKEDVHFEYHDTETDTETSENPFSALKNLTFRK